MAGDTTSGTVSADGTRLRWWSGGDPDGTPVVLSNGLGASPAAWPFLAEPGGGFRAVTWHHRGLGGSERPADPERIGLADHADDMLAVMDAAGIDSALVVGWSLGVGVALEVARRAPERVSGLMVLGGTAGGAFRVLPANSPAVLERGAARATGWMLRVVGPPIAGLISLLPRGLDASGPGGALFTPPPVQTLAEVAREFAAHDWTWFSKLVLAAAEHGPVATDDLAVPVTVVAGEFDTLAPPADMAALAASLPPAAAARLVRLPGSHFLPLQFPDALRAELASLRDRG